MAKNMDFEILKRLETLKIQKLQAMHSGTIKKPNIQSLSLMLNHTWFLVFFSHRGMGHKRTVPRYPTKKSPHFYVEATEEEDNDCAHPFSHHQRYGTLLHFKDILSGALRRSFSENKAFMVHRHFTKLQYHNRFLLQVWAYLRMYLT